MRNLYSKIAILLGFLAIFTCRVQNPNWGANGNYGLTAYDDFGYYLYLPALFLHNDIALEDQEWIDEVREKYHPSPYFYQAHALKSGYVIQYSTGMAVLLSPAFFTAHIYALIDERYPADGFSIPYQIGILAYALIIMLAGFIFLRKFLLRLFSDHITALILICLIFGTNFFHIALNNTSSPHVLLFSLYCLLLWLTAKWYETLGRKYFLMLCIAFALLCLSRPNEMIFAFFVLLWTVSSREELKGRIKFLKRGKPLLIRGSIIILLIGSLQVIYWLYTTGKPIYDSYKLEDFKLLSPYLTEFLFSYKKGWLLYTPLMIFSLFGMFMALRKRESFAFAVAVFGFLNIWILSSWDCWWYADSFSQRSMVQSYPVYMISLGYFFKEVSAKRMALIKLLVGLLTIAFISLNLFQIWQQWHGILHSKRMTKAYYWDIFGQTSFKEKWKKDLELERGMYAEIGQEIDHFKMAYFNDFSKPEGIHYSDPSCVNLAENGTLRLSSKDFQSQKISFALSDLSNDIDFYYIVKVDFKSDTPIAENPFSIITEVRDHRSGKQYGWGNIDSENQEIDTSAGPNAWRSFSGIFVPPYPRSFDDSIHTFLWNRGRSDIAFDNLAITVAQNELAEKHAEQSYLWSGGKGNQSDKWVKNSNYRTECGYELVDSSNIYSTTMISTKHKVLEGKKISIIASILNEKSDQASLVVSINRGLESPFYKKFNIPKKSGWQVVKKTLTLPTDVSDSTDLRFYCMNQGERVLIDYLRLDAKKP